MVLIFLDFGGGGGAHNEHLIVYFIFYHIISCVQVEMIDARNRSAVIC